MICPYCACAVGPTGSCERCGAVGTSITLTGWRPDPTARHEGRYYVAGRPTGRVRNGKAESTDPAGGQLLGDYLGLPTTAKTSIRSTWLGTGIATFVIALLGVVVWGLLARHQHPTADADYLLALHNSELGGQFNSDANALAHGRQVCRQLNDGGPQQGSPADKIAVDVFCQQFAEGFHVLENLTVAGTFVLSDTQPIAEFRSIDSDGTSCVGTAGFSDIGPDTQVTVTNGHGDILTTTALGKGSGDGANCTFSFHVELTEGEDHYVVTVGRRGDFTYTFGQLQESGVGIRLGE